MLITSSGLRSLIPEWVRVDRVSGSSRCAFRALLTLFLLAGLGFSTAQATPGPPVVITPPLEGEPPAELVDNECGDETYTELALQPGDWSYHVNDETYEYSAEIPFTCWFYGNVATDLYLQAELWCDGEMVDAWWSRPGEVKLRTAPPDPQLCSIKSGLFGFENEGHQTDPIPGAWGSQPFAVRHQRVGFVGNVSDIPSIELLPWFWPWHIWYGDFPEFEVVPDAPGASVVRVDYYSDRTHNFDYPRLIHDFSLIEEFAEPIHSSLSAPFRMTEEVSWRPAPGVNYMVAKVTDSLGRSAWSDLHRFRVVQNAPPQLRAYLQSPDPISAPANVSIRAEATDDDPDMGRVEFYIGAATTPTYIDSDPVWESSMWNYDFPMSNLPAGNYSVWVVAYDSRGLSTRVGPVSFTVTNAAPVVAIATPADASTAASPASFVLTATATDETGIQRVEFYDNGTNLIGTDTTAPYSINWSNVDAGVHRVTAKAHDLTTPTAQMTESAPVSLYVTNKNVNLPPRILVTAPVPGAIVKTGSSMTITANARDFDTSGKVQQIRFFKGNETSAFATYAGLNLQQVTQVSSAFLAPATPGLYALRAQATDKTSPGSGDWVDSAVISVNVVSNLPPNVTLTSPAKGASITAPAAMPFAVSASDADGTVTKIEYFRDDRLLATVTSSPFAWSGPSQAGSFGFWARATDNLGATTDSERVQLTVATAAGNTPPAVALVSPLRGAAIGRPATFKLQATASDANGTISAVEFFEGPLLLVTDSAAPYEHQLLNVPEGAHTYWARAIDNQGSSAESLRIPVYVTGLSPTIRWIAPAAGTLGQVAPASINAVVDATDSDGSVARVEFWNGSTLVGESAEGPGFAFTYAALPAGNHQLKAIAFDGAENFASTAVIPLTVAVNQIPTLSVALPAQNASYSELQRISTAVTAADGNAPFGSVKRVEYVLDGNTQSPYVGLFPSFAVDFPAPAPGAHQLKITAYDDKNAASITVTRNFAVIAAAPPVVQMAAPGSSNADGLILLNQPGQNLEPDKVKLSATITDPDAAYGGQIQSVQFFGKLLPNGQPFIVPAVSGTTAPNYRAEWSLTGSTTQGDYQFWVKAVDNGPTGAPLRNTTEIAGVSVPIRLNVAPSAVKITSPVLPSSTRGPENPAPRRAYPATVLFAGGNTQLTMSAVVTDANANVASVRFILQTQDTLGNMIEVPLEPPVVAATPGQVLFSKTVNLQDINGIAPSKFPILVKAEAVDTRTLSRSTLPPLEPNVPAFVQCGGEYVPCTNTSVPIAYVPQGVARTVCGGAANGPCTNAVPELAAPSNSGISWTRFEGERLDRGGQAVSSFVRNRNPANALLADAVIQSCPDGSVPGGGGSVLLQSATCVLDNVEDGEAYHYSLNVPNLSPAVSATAMIRGRLYFPPPESLITSLAPLAPDGVMYRNGVNGNSVSVQVSGQYIRPGGTLEIRLYGKPVGSGSQSSLGTVTVTGSSLTVEAFSRTMNFTVPSNWPDGDIELWTEAKLRQLAIVSPPGDPVVLGEIPLTENNPTHWNFRFRNAQNSSGTAALAESSDEPRRFELFAVPPMDSVPPTESSGRSASDRLEFAGVEAAPAPDSTGGCDDTPIHDPYPAGTTENDPNRGQNWFIISFCSNTNVVPNNYYATYRTTRSGIKVDYLEMALVTPASSGGRAIELTEPYAGQHFNHDQTLTARALIAGVQIGEHYTVRFLEKLPGAANATTKAEVPTTNGTAIASWTVSAINGVPTTLQLGAQLVDNNNQVVASFPAVTALHEVVVDPPGANQAPTVTFTQPNANGATVAVGQVVNLVATTTDPDPGQTIAPASTRFSLVYHHPTLGDQFVRDIPAAFTAGTMSAEWTVQEAAGNYAIVARAKDSVGLEGTATRQVTIGNASTPVAFISSPTSGTSLAPGATITTSISLSGTYSGRKLRLALSDTDAVTERASVLSAAISSSPAAMDLATMGVPVGSYLLTAQVETAVGSNVFGAKSQAVLIHLAVSGQQSPVVNIINPSDNGWVYLSGSNATMQATVSDADGLIEFVTAELIVGGTPQTLATSFNPQTGVISADFVAVPNAQLKVTARDNDQNVGTATRTYNLASATSVQATRSYAYDAHQMLCKVINPESGATIYGYDPVGNLLWTSEGATATANPATCNRELASSGNLIERSYDEMNRLQRISYPDTLVQSTLVPGDDIAYTYYDDGALKSVSVLGPSDVERSRWDYTYNNRRMQNSEKLRLDGQDYLVSYDHNANGHLQSLTYPGGRVIGYAPNALGQPNTVSEGSTQYARSISYHPNGAIAGFTYGNGITHTMTPNARRLPQRSLSMLGGVKVLDDTYDYDRNGNVLDIIDGVDGTLSRGMDYDNLDRLTLALVSSGLWNASHYRYDALDNIRSANQGGRQFLYEYDSNQRLTHMLDPGMVNTIALQYNTVGDVTRKNDANYTYDSAHRMLAVAGIASYQYDGHGRRIKETKLSGSTPVEIGFYNQAGQKLYSKKGSVETHNVYFGGSLLATIETGAPATITYLHTDALGSVVAKSAGNNGAILQRHRYTPYGETYGSILDGLGYTGHDMDADTGLTYMQQRYYDPVVGRFLAIDPVAVDGSTGANFGRYSYGKNNPYRFSDPDGRQAAERFVEQHRRDMESGNGKIYDPLVGPAVVVTAIMLAPLATEILPAVLANAPALNTAGVTAVEMVAGDALGTTSLAISGPAALKLGGEVLDDIVEVTQASVRAALQGSTMQTTQKSISLPAVERYVRRIEAGEVAPAIKVDGNVIVDGNHRYAAGRVAGVEPTQVPGTMNTSDVPRPVDDLIVDPADYGNH